MTKGQSASAMALHALQHAGPGGRSGAVHTLAETAAFFGMSYDSVRKIEQRAFMKLRRNCEVRKLAELAGLLKKKGEE